MVVPHPGRLVRILGLGALLLAVAVGLGLFLVRRAPEERPADVPPDPRLAYAGPFRNVAPSVRYVPEERCADCHADKARSFAEHPMGRSLLPANQMPPLPEDARHDNPFEALASRFQVVHEAGRVWHRRALLDPAGRPLVEQAWPVDYAIGSGLHGFSYLSDRDGYLFQTPISWYSQKEVWGLSPGFGPSHAAGRAVLPECLFCHANRADHIDGSVNRYARPAFNGHAIGCQRCHGPGEVHVAAREKPVPDVGVPDLTIVNPRHLERSPRDAVCEQCHLGGDVRVTRRGRGLYDFRPGLPLDEFWAVFVRAAGTAEGQKAVGHVEQMYQSRCFRRSDGPTALGCVSCHDPHEHVAPAQRVAHYRARCLQCHQQRGCSVPMAERVRQSPQDSCVDCHMPRYGASDIPHTASTDHRILRGGKAAPRDDELAAPAGGLPIVAFYRDRKGAGGGEDERDLGVALVKLTLEGKAPAARVTGPALPLLDAAVRRAPDDLAAGEARGYALGLRSLSAEALAAFEAVLARAPEREASLIGAASMAEALEKTEAALSYWRRAVAANPWAADARRRLALLLVKKRAWDEASAECEAWVRIDPFSAEARASSVVCLLAAGRKDEARAEFARLEALAPENLAELRARFEKKLK